MNSLYASPAVMIECREACSPWSAGDEEWSKPTWSEDNDGEVQCRTRSVHEVVINKSALLSLSPMSMHPSHILVALVIVNGCAGMPRMSKLSNREADAVFKN
jgi:hypothetical protein